MSHSPNIWIECVLKQTSFTSRARKIDAKDFMKKWWYKNMEENNKNEKLFEERVGTSPDKHENALHNLYNWSSVVLTPE